LITCLVRLKLVYCVLEIACELVWFYMATSRHLSIAQTGSNFENFNFFVVFSAYRVQKSKMLNLSHTNGQPWNHGRRQSDGNFFFVKIGFSPIKSPNSSRKSINFFFFKSLNQYFILTSFIRSKKSQMSQNEPKMPIPDIMIHIILKLKYN
jgi:hypothetical protein